MEEEFFEDLGLVSMDVFGPAAIYEDDRGLYLGFSETHPLVDIPDAVISGPAISELPEVMEVMELTAPYIERRADELATLSFAVGKVRDVIAEQEGAVSPEQTVIFDVMDVVREIPADPQLWADLMEAIRDPILERSGEALNTLNLCVLCSASNGRRSKSWKSGNFSECGFVLSQERF